MAILAAPVSGNVQILSFDVLFGHNVKRERSDEDKARARLSRQARAPSIHQRMTNLPAGGRGFLCRWCLVRLMFSRGDRVLDVCTGTGEAALAIISAIGASGLSDWRGHCPGYARERTWPTEGAGFFAGSCGWASVAAHGWHL